MTGFNPDYAYVKAEDLTATYTVTFETQTMYDDFKESLMHDETRWTFNDNEITATF